MRWILALVLLAGCGGEDEDDDGAGGEAAAAGCEEGGAQEHQGPAPVDEGPRCNGVDEFEDAPTCTGYQRRTDLGLETATVSCLLPCSPSDVTESFTFEAERHEDGTLGCWRVAVGACEWCPVTGGPTPMGGAACPDPRDLL